LLYLTFEKPARIMLGTQSESNKERAIEIAKKAVGILIATSVSAKVKTVGMGGCIRDTQANNNGDVMSSYSTTLGTRTEHNPYTAELEAIAAALKRIPLRSMWTFY
jgi:hypothetical protein